MANANLVTGFEYKLSPQAIQNAKIEWNAAGTMVTSGNTIRPLKFFPEGTFRINECSSRSLSESGIDFPAVNTDGPEFRHP